MRLEPRPLYTHHFLREDLPHLKGCFPFRLGTTSYILPAPILPNLKFLAPYVDEVELVLFQSAHEENLPSKNEIKEMVRLSRDMELSYNVHFPTDVFLADPDSKVRDGSVDTLLRFYERTFPLKPTTYVLHLETRSSTGERIQDQAAWYERTAFSLESLWRGGMEPGQVAVENLDYPPSALSALLEQNSMPYCVDVGHLLRYGIEVQKELEHCMKSCAMIHLHGVVEGVDHRDLDFLPDSLWNYLGARLKDFQGGLSIEVFSLEDLAVSLGKVSQWTKFHEFESRKKSHRA